ncbi:HlyD family secretion protein [Magnetospirillum gryphiswaldense]|uniref:HlyD family secretion protein n=1 Tax=Magnetospirillum gryphiswaldense TaxID=55518 RepID=UPI000D03C75A|nr:HlyD family secretion protein [Magnetospirillum gryphiswaldense]AVM75904.1 Multidrug export protein EmrA [Magnetospirillum gryphiswaldense MSR-1]AVM79807.1 Multidrug export protein EmrA [Magnetospirillum gryphiswaldense]
MKKTILRLFALALLCVAALYGWRWYADGRFLETTDDAYVDGDITTMTPKLAGHIVEVAVTDNQRVKTGDLLIRIDDTDYRSKLAEAEAVLAARRATLAQLDDKVLVQQAVMQQAGAGISAAKADLTLSRQDLDRTSRLVKDDFVSRQRFDTQTAEAAKAAAGLQGSSAQATAAKRQMAVLEADRDVAQAQVNQAQAQVNQALADLDATIIRAPVDGVIGNRVARTGAYVRPGQHLLSVVPLDSVWIDANFKETQLARLKPGQSVSIKIDAFPEHVLTGTVDSFSPATGAKFSLLPPENATGNFTKIVQRLPVRIHVPADNPLAGRLAPGLSVVVSVDTRSGVGK